MTSSLRTETTRRLLVRFLLAMGGVASLYYLFTRIEYPWNWRVPWEYRSLFIRGFANTLAVSLGATSLGFCFGVIGGLARVSKNLVAREVAGFYVELFRGTPLLVQIYIFYFCVAAAVHFDNPQIIGMVTLAFFSGAYITEMVREQGLNPSARVRSRPPNPPASTTG